MNIGKLCTRGVVTVTRETSITEAARIMRERNVGDLVVVEEREGKDAPVGMLTDRDIVVGILARDTKHIDLLDVGDVIAGGVLTAEESDDLATVLETMRKRAVRRVPIVDARGALVGIFTVDDLLGLLAGDLATVAGMVSRQREVESQRRL